jgi:hypothetical protein
MRVPTSYEVWKAIRYAHPDMKVFGSFSAPDGDYFGNPNKGRMLTSYGFANGDHPVIEAETTWDIDREKPWNRINEQHKYWLCIPKKEG